LNIGSKYVPVEANLPGLAQCFLFRSQYTGCDGRCSPQFFSYMEGTNLVGATLTTPDGMTYTMEVEPDEVNFNLASLTEDALSRFTNGIYTIRLYDIDNVSRQTYEIPVSGTPVTETPQLVTPDAICSSNLRPYLSWNAAADPDVNATMLQIESPSVEDDLFNIWTRGEYDPLPTSYESECDLFGGWTYDLMFANASLMIVNGATVMAGHLSERYGFFNVATQKVAFVHVDADAPRVFAGDDLDVGLTSFGFLQGPNYTVVVDFGDGTTTNAEWGIHQYTQPGTYPVRVIVTDGTGASATGTVYMTAYALPAISGLHRTDSGNGATVVFPTIDGASYRLLYADGLNTPDWRESGGALTGDGSIRSVDDYPSGSVSQRFYRLECTLNPADAVP